MDPDRRVVVLIDMDCFYCQVEEKLNPELKGKPIAVVQYNPWKGGGIIAVNYVARDRGVTRHMRGDEAKEKCPEIELPSVPCTRGKADISRYREAGKDVARVLHKFTPLLERASIDEAYLDITSAVEERLRTLNTSAITINVLLNTFALGYDSLQEFMNDVNSGTSDCIDFDYEHAKRLLVGSVIVSEMRTAVFQETGYHCSAGIAHNKILAKLVCGMNKPNKQTILPKHSIDILYNTLPIKKVKHLGGKFGYSVCGILKISTMGELKNFTEKQLQNKFDEKNGSWLYNIARGTDLEPVQARFNPKSIGCCKNFKGKSALIDLDSLRKWIKELADEIEDRLEKDALENSRTPKQLVVSFATQLPDGKDMSSSRSYNFVADVELCGDLFANKALDLVLEGSEGLKLKDGEPNRKLKAPITFLGISVGKFEDHAEVKKTKKIKDYFSIGSGKEGVSRTMSTSKNTDNHTSDKDKPPEVNVVKEFNVRKNLSTDKNYILNKFFKQSDLNCNIKTVEETSTTDTENITTAGQKVVESSLDKQESFFAKMLKENICNNDIDFVYEKTADKPTTSPVCDIIKCGEDSNDTDYSTSTINAEINKSIALFEDDPEDFERVAKTRELLKSNANTENNPPAVENCDKYECPECGKSIFLTDLEVHSDYHLALKLRSEERQVVRKEKDVLATKDEVKRVKKPPDVPGNVNEKSIANFFEKFDSNVPMETCSECGKRVSLVKFIEHLDFHEAQKLNRVLNNKSNMNSINKIIVTSNDKITMNCNNNIMSNLNNNVKRKRKSTSPTKKSKMQCKSITNFFKSNVK